MSVAPLASAPIAIQIHATAAALSVAIGLFVLFRRKGDGLHVGLGRIWVLLMAILATSAFFIGDITRLSPLSVLYALAAFVLWTLWRGLVAIWRGDVVRHKQHMRALYFYALLIAGVFTLVPGRTLNTVATGGHGGWWPLVLAAIVAGLVAAAYFLNRRRIDRFPPTQIAPRFPR